MRWTTATGCPPRPPSPTHDAPTRSRAPTQAPSQVPALLTHTKYKHTHIHAPSQVPTPLTHIHTRSRPHSFGIALRTCTSLDSLPLPLCSHSVYHISILAPFLPSLMPTPFPSSPFSSLLTPPFLVSACAVMQSAAALAAGSLAFAKRDSAYAAKLLTHARSVTHSTSLPSDAHI